MKKQLSARVKAILSLAVVLAVVTAIVSGLFGTTWLGKTVQAVMTPLRSGVSAITRQVERYYNYVFGYEALEAENDYLEKRIMQIEDEITSKMSSNQLELNIIMVAPVLIVGMLRLSNQTFAENFASPMGVVVITIGLGLFYLAYRMGRGIVDEVK